MVTAAAAWPGIPIRVWRLALMLLLMAAPFAALLLSRDTDRSLSSGLFLAEFIVLGVAALVVFAILIYVIAPRSRIAAIEYVALFVGTLMTFVATFAAIYFQLSARTAKPFHPVMISRLDSVYFTVTTFATVGSRYEPLSQGAQAIVLIQVVIGFLLATVLIGIGLHQLLNLADGS